MWCHFLFLVDILWSRQSSDCSDCAGQLKTDFARVGWGGGRRCRTSSASFLLLILQPRADMTLIASGLVAEGGRSYHWHVCCCFCLTAHPSSRDALMPDAAACLFFNHSARACVSCRRTNCTLALHPLLSRWSIGCALNCSALTETVSAKVTVRLCGAAAATVSE